ncbi:MAG: FAD-dependent oxidoreductase [Brockia lithotrophica]|nr:FAD-dependent oxidoreductase [Brockia lithotrophica]
MAMSLPGETGQLPFGDPLVADYLVVGAGAAGLATALCLGKYGSVVLVSKGPPRVSASSRAQGGIACPLPEELDEHAEDTRRAGGALVDEGVLRTYLSRVPDAFAFLEELGVPFERAPNGSLVRVREGGYAHARVARTADHIGRSLTVALTRTLARAPAVRSLTYARLLRILVHEGSAVGALFARRGIPFVVLARTTFLATGGFAGLFARSTHAAHALGEGTFLAWEAGAVLRDLEFVQFHPTALARGRLPLPLLTEALRGSGARIVDEAGVPLLEGIHPLGDLAPRDAVARTLYEEGLRGRSAFLDLRPVTNLRQSFPTVWHILHRAGFDPERPVPVTPAAHYAIGGIFASTEGRTTLPRLYALGEAASTGFHGANRLASNSLLEIFAQSLLACEDATRAEAPPPGAETIRRARKVLARVPRGLPDVPKSALLRRVRELLWRRAGIVRDGAELRAARDELLRLRRKLAARVSPEAVPFLPDAAVVGTAALFVRSALAREESRGVHARRDFPRTDERPRHTILFPPARPETWGWGTADGFPSPEEGDLLRVDAKGTPNGFPSPPAFPR